ncbi:MAG: TetR/AcrR family transcriptional regulator [Thiotrichales bacterium]|nr:TetR/AcrR family transcriptional regulator [Thiotrichales bacterium]MBN2607102.1 TetR/AcrR family transcriptional regulator [Thiotrichales bacterium]
MKQNTSDDSRKKLLDSAFQEIYKCGFQSASLSAILSETGLTKGALYHHFPTKKDLGLAVIDEVIYRALEERFLGPLKNSDTPLQTLLEIIDRTKERTLIRVELGCPLNNLVQEMSPLDEQFKDHLARVVTLWQGIVEEALLRSQKLGEIRADIDCKDTALFIFAAFEGCIGAAKNMQSAEVLASCIDRLHDYVSGLKNDQ